MATTLTLAAKIAALEAGRKETRTKVKVVTSQPVDVQGRKMDSLRIRQTRTIPGMSRDIAVATAVVRMAHRAMSGTTADDLGMAGATAASLHTARRSLIGGLVNMGIAPADLPDAILQACDDLGATLSDGAKFSIGLEGALAALGQARAFAEVLRLEEAGKQAAAAEAAAKEAKEADEARLKREAETKAKRAAVAAKATPKSAPAPKQAPARALTAAWAG